ncbi:MAG: succinate dehydrogenase, hydrophobic membrane anchor protein [Gammaproteobacteria bacterium RIFCSPHIGHO2_12_FULL_41_20]|nr:MAG: succinate dehydrogenase, hydrophobic membrane anchor protein [Gammaproteobacteria bacterium RIFCSPHIGHO2_12_FULL_41_20]
MVKTVLSTSHQGLRDWLHQRVSAIAIAIYSIGLVGYFVLHPDLSYAEWHGLFTHLWMKIATLLFFLSMLLHAWVGVWTIVTDYVKPYAIRLVLDILIFFALLACFFWAFFILWSV